MRIIIKDLNELEDFANKFASKLQKGDAICLNGELGSGKTQFVALCAKKLGYEDEVTSPTFCFMNEYQISQDFSIYHFDLYRLNDPSELSEIGFDDFGYNPESGISFIEWSSLFSEDMPDDAINIDFYGHGSEPRTLHISGTCRLVL